MTRRRPTGTRTVWILAALAGSLTGQDKLEFDAASIEPNMSVRIGIVTYTADNGDFTATNVTLRNLIGYACQLREFQTSGGPKWVDSERYDVLARPPHDADPPGSSRQQRDERNRIRTRSPLAERFQLVVHNETKDMPVYAAVIAKNGPHLEIAKNKAQQGIEGRSGTPSAFRYP